MANFSSVQNHVTPLFGFYERRSSSLLSQTAHLHITSTRTGIIAVQGVPQRPRHDSMVVALDAVEGGKRGWVRGVKGVGVCREARRGLSIEDKRWVSMGFVSR